MIPFPFIFKVCGLWQKACVDLKNKEPSMVSITTSPAKAAHSKATLHVECCTKQSESFPRTVDKTLSSLPFNGIYN